MEPQRDGRFELAPGVTVSPGSLRFAASRSGGPGGQHVNTTASKVTLHCPVSAIQGLDEAGRARLRALAGSRLSQTDEIVLSAEDSRSQYANRSAVLERLAELVQRARHRPKKRRPTRPGRGAVERRLDGKRQTAQKKARRRQRPDPE